MLGRINMDTKNDGTSQGVADSAKILTPLLNNLLAEAAAKGISLKFKIVFRENGVIKTCYHNLDEIQLYKAIQFRDLKV